MNERIDAARNRVRTFERAVERLAQLKAESEKLRERVDLLAARLGREQKDVDQLEELSLRAIWHSLRGDKPEALAEEKRQLLYAKLKHDQAAAQWTETESQRKAMAEQVEALRGASEEHAHLCAEAERTLRDAGGPIGERLREIAGESAGLQDVLRQLREAESAAFDATECLSGVDDQLGSARNWGGVDMLGGGILTTALKHSRINSARSSLARSQVKLRALERELGDVGRVEQFSIDIGSFATLSDYVFDGLIVDWFVQSRIHEARERVTMTIADVRRIAADLRAQERRARAALERLAIERQSLVESADAQE